MRLRSLAGLFCSSLTIAVMGLAACGSEDGKKKNNDGKYNAGGDGGIGASGGEGATPQAGAGSGGLVGEGGDGTGEGGTAGTAGTAPTAGSSSVDGGAGGTGGETGEGGAGGDGTVIPFRGLYIGPEGSDTADGTVDAPFKTLAHAASLAVAGDTIVFLPGDYTLTPPAVSIADGVNLMAQSSGESFLSGTGALLTLQGDTRISGLDIENFSTPITFAGAAAASGTVTIEDTRFESCAQSCLTLPGASKAVVIGDGDAVLANGGGAFAILTETASLSITEGVLQNFQSGVLRANDQSAVQLTDIIVDGGTGVVLTLRDDSTGVVEGATFTTLSASLLQQFDATELSVIGSDLSMRGGTPFNCITTAQTSKLTVEGSKLHDCGTGIKSGPPLELTIIDTEFYDLDFGTEMNPGGGPVAETTILIEGCHLHDISSSALRFGASASTKLNLKIRDTVVDVATQANSGGVILDGTNASQIDLGTLADPGGNTFLQRNTTTAHTALQLNFAAVTVYAVGNTWTPLQQNAGADGRYAVVTGKVLDITDAVSSGRNYTKPNNTTTLRLAQIP